MRVIFRRMMQFHKIGTQRRKISDNDFSFGHESIFLVEDDIQQADRNIDKLMAEEDTHFWCLTLQRR